MQIRDDLTAAHDAAWTFIASPGSWFTGPQRIEIAATTLAAIADDDPPPPWVPFSTTGRLGDDPLAPVAAHDVAARLARHAGTVTRDVYVNAADQIGELPYVEVCSIVSTVAAIAHFRRNIGASIPDLPEPIAGPATGDRPADVVDATLNWVPVAAPADEVAAVMQAYSAVPSAQQNLWRLATAQYIAPDEMMDPSWSRRPDGLTRAQTELVAARVAQLRECFY